MSSMDPMRGGFLIRYATKLKTSLQQSHFKQTVSTKSSLLMKQITRATMSSSFLGQTLKRFTTTVDSSSPAITRTKSLNLSTADVQWSISELEERKSKKLQEDSLLGSKRSLIKKKLSTIKESLLNSFTSIFLTGDEY